MFVFQPFHRRSGLVWKWRGEEGECAYLTLVAGELAATGMQIGPHDWMKRTYLEGQKSVNHG